MTFYISGLWDIFRAIYFCTVTGNVKPYDHSGNAFAELALKIGGLFCITMMCGITIVEKQWNSDRPEIHTCSTPSSQLKFPRNFWLFTKLKQVLKDQHFSSIAVRKWIKSKPQDFFMDGMKKWIACWEKCIAVSGNSK